MKKHEGINQPQNTSCCQITVADLHIQGGGSMSIYTRWSIYNICTVVALQHVNVPFNCRTVNIKNILQWNPDTFYCNILVGSNVVNCPPLECSSLQAPISTKPAPGYATEKCVLYRTVKIEGRGALNGG